MNADQLTLFHVVSLAPPNDFFQTWCRDCGVNVRANGEQYMVHDEVWPIEKDGGVLCVGCVEARIGRRLVPEDFTDCGGNRGGWRRSRRLDDRLGPRVPLELATRGDVGRPGRHVRRYPGQRESPVP